MSQEHTLKFERDEDGDIAALKGKHYCGFIHGVRRDWNSSMRLAPLTSSELRQIADYMDSLQAEVKV